MVPHLSVDNNNKQISGPGPTEWLPLVGQHPWRAGHGAEARRPPAGAQMPAQDPVMGGAAQPFEAHFKYTLSAVEPDLKTFLATAFCLSQLTKVNVVRVKPTDAQKYLTKQR